MSIRQRLARASPAAIDRGLAAVLIGLTVLMLIVDSDSDRPVAQFSAGAIAAGAVLFRRRWPIPSMAIAAAAGIAGLHLALQGPAALALLISAYTVSVETTRRVAIGFALSVSAGIVAVAVIFNPAWWTGGDTPVPMIAWTLVGAAIGDAVRSRRAAQTAARERARQTELASREEAKRQIAEERLRIARDVHDLVGHHIAVINVQAGVASHVLREDPDAASEALGHVRRSSTQALEELGVLLSVLRERDGADTALPTEPTGVSSTSIETLLESSRAAGLEVEISVSGQVFRLPPAVDMVAHRIVQESLTNAHKHGTGRAHLTLTYDPALFTVEVRNEAVDAAPTPKGPAGHGITGMRERAALVGGTLTAGPVAERWFAVRAELPVGTREEE